MKITNIFPPVADCCTAISDRLTCGSGRNTLEAEAHEMNRLPTQRDSVRPTPARPTGQQPPSTTSMAVALRARLLSKSDPGANKSTQPDGSQTNNQASSQPGDHAPGKRLSPAPIDVTPAKEGSQPSGPLNNVVEDTGHTTSPSSSLTDTPSTVRPPPWRPSLSLSIPNTPTTPRTPKARRNEAPAAPEILVQDPSGAPFGAPLGAISEVSAAQASGSVPRAPTVDKGIEHFVWTLNQVFNLDEPLPKPINPNIASSEANSDLGFASQHNDGVQGYPGVEDKVQPWLAALNPSHTSATPSLASLHDAPVQPLASADDHRHTASDRTSLRPPAHLAAASENAESAMNIPLPPSVTSHGGKTSASGPIEPRAALPLKPKLNLQVPPSWSAPTRSLSVGTSRRGAGKDPVSPFYTHPPLPPSISGPQIVLGSQNRERPVLQPIAGPGTERESASASNNFADRLPAVRLTDTANFGAHLGSGAFSTVHRTIVMIDDKETECAIKTFKSDYQHVGRAEAETQVGILNALRGYSDHIVKYYGHVSTITVDGKLEPVPLGAEDSTISIAMELVNGPTVDKLEAGFASLTTEEKLLLSKKIMHDVLRGAADLFGKGFAHNDFKPNNLIWSEDENRVKLLDISNAGRFLEEKPMSHPFYTGPERIGHMPAEGLFVHPPSTARIRLPEPLQITARDSLQVFLDEFKEHYLPLHPTSDSYGIGQILHKLVQGTYFLPVAPAVMERHRSSNFTDVQSILLATILGWAGKNRPAEVFDETKKRADSEYALKTQHGFFDAVNQLMAVDYKTRITPEEALKLPFFTENFPDDSTCKALYEKCRQAAATLQEQNDDASDKSPSLYPPTDQGSWVPGEPVQAPLDRSATVSNTGETGTSGNTSDLFQGGRPNAVRSSMNQ